jgi:Ni,Fe-hydrogenase III component G
VSWLEQARELADGRLEQLTGWDDAPRSYTFSVVLLVRRAGRIEQRLTTVEHGGALESLTPLWPGARWYERLLAETLGISIPGAQEPLLGVARAPLQRRGGDWPGSYDPAGKRFPKPVP